MISLTAICEQLARQATTIAALTEGIDDSQATLRLKPGEWNMLEVMCHLYDEEINDFRIRVIQTVTQPTLPLPAIDPEAWVISHQYASQSFTQIRNRFLAARAESITLLQSLLTPDWQTSLNHPILHELRAGDVVWSWLGHDMLHIRQLNELWYLYTIACASPWKIGYAGDWQA